MYKAIRCDIEPNAAKQPYDAFLVLDVEATCQPGTDFNYANEIIASLSSSSMLQAGLTAFLRRDVGMARVSAAVELQRRQRKGQQIGSCRRVS